MAISLYPQTRTPLPHPDPLLAHRLIRPSEPMLLAPAALAFTALVGTAGAASPARPLLRQHALRAKSVQSAWAETSPVQTYLTKLIKTYPHVKKPWTQGLLWMPYQVDGMLIETVGDYPPGSGSYFRALDVHSGQELQQLTDGLQGVFAEGMTQRGDNFYMSTYNSRKILEYNGNMQIVASHDYPYEGWGLAYDTKNDRFLATNSTAALMFLDKETLQLAGVREVTCMGKSVEGMNELEYISDFKGQGPVLMGNIINTRVVLMVNPETAACVGMFHLQGPGLEYMDPTEQAGYHVANGIAYDAAKGTFFVTGKNWRNMFEIDLVKEGSIGTHQASVLLEAHLAFAKRAGSLVPSA